MFGCDVTVSPYFFASIAYNGVGQSMKERQRKELFLIVDDHERIVDVLRQYALHDGYDVVTAADGRQALDLFHARIRPHSARCGDA